MENSVPKLELRSEKVRNIVGTIPPVLLRIGILMISMVIILMLVALYYIPYPEVKTLRVTIKKTNEQYYATGDLEIKKARVIKKGQTVKVNVESIRGDYSILGSVDSVYEHKDRGCVDIMLHNVDYNQRSVLDMMQSGEASIKISEKSILKRIMYRAR